MTMMTATETTNLTRELEGAIPPGFNPLMARTLVRQLADGEPVTVERLAGELRRPTPEVDGELADLPYGVYRDDAERIVGFWGIAAVGETPHRMELGGRTVHAWCAWDTLFLPIVLGERVDVASTCPQTGEEVTLTVSPDGVENLAPAGARMTFLQPPEGGFSGDVIRVFCQFIHFASSEGAAEAWTAGREGTFALSVAEGFELARFWAARLFGVESGENETEG